MIINLDNIAEEKAKELGISKESAKYIIRCFNGLIKEIVEDSGFDKDQEYTEEEFNTRFKNLRFKLPKIGTLVLSYNKYKRYKDYVENRKADTNA